MLLKLNMVLEVVVTVVVGEARVGELVLEKLLVPTHSAHW